MKKVFVSWNDVQRQTQDIIRQMVLDDWRPDYVVGITRGGLAPAVLISQYFNARMETLKISLRDGDQCETNCWMSEDAFGYVFREDRSEDSVISDPLRRKRILIVDDINDSGDTLNWLKQDWQGTCMPQHPAWQDIWNQTVRVAVLYQNESSGSLLTPDYAAETINKLETPQWIVFPWEEWWRRWNPDEEHQ